MTIWNKKEALLLFIGDIVFFTIALWFMLFVRYFEFPSADTFLRHLVPFSVLFIVWVLVFFIAGLYEKHTVILKNKLPSIIFNAQLTNSAIAVLFFYLIPYFGITPKTSLFIYLFISFFFILFWRIYGHSFFGPIVKQRALLIGSGKELYELYEEVNQNNRYNISFVSLIDLDEAKEIDFKRDILERINKENISIVVIDLENKKIDPILPYLYNLIFLKINFIDMYKVYEDIFDRIPLSLLHYNWFLENISNAPKATYDFFKRSVDVVISFFLGIVFVLIFPFVWLAIKFDDGGPVFIVQERIGKGDKKINVLKFRTMNTNDRGIWVIEKDNRITKVGGFMRKSRIDELPQFWNILKGDMSLIGPRPDIYDLGISLEKQIPYYSIRNIIKPGITGWAQTRQEIPPQTLEETKKRLVYDFYYIKNRSIILDLKIALQTIKTLLSRAGK